MTCGIHCPYSLGYRIFSKLQNNFSSFLYAGSQELMFINKKENVQQFRMSFLPFNYMQCAEKHHSLLARKYTLGANICTSAEVTVEPAVTQVLNRFNGRAVQPWSSRATYSTGPRTSQANSITLYSAWTGNYFH